MNQPIQENKERKCDGCKLFGNMGVHSFTCPIRSKPITIIIPNTSREEIPEWEQRFDEKWDGCFSDQEGDYVNPEVKDFIRVEKELSFLAGQEAERVRVREAIMKKTTQYDEYGQDSFLEILSAIEPKS